MAAHSVIVGELEATFITAICRNANLQAVLDRGDIPSGAKPLVDAFTRVTNEDHRGTRLADETHHPPARPPKKIELSQPIYQLLVQLLNQRSQPANYTTTRDDPRFVHRSVLELDKISIRGVIYATTKSLPRDSNVIFRKPSDPTMRPGKVTVIFSSSHPGTGRSTVKANFLVIEEYLPVANAASQRTYQQFGFAGGFLCQNTPSDVVHLVEVGDVVCHFAKTFVGHRDGDEFHALPLNKVR